VLVKTCLSFKTSCIFRALHSQEQTLECAFVDLSFIYELTRGSAMTAVHPTTTEVGAQRARCSRKRGAALLGVAAVAGIASAAAVSLRFVGTDSSPARGGGPHVWIVGVLPDGTVYDCTGSAFTANAVLTAASCLLHHAPPFAAASNIYAAIGEGVNPAIAFPRLDPSRLADASHMNTVVNGTWLRSTRATPHPSYAPYVSAIASGQLPASAGTDLGVVEFEGSPFTEFVALDAAGQAPDVARLVPLRAYGYGISADSTRPQGLSSIPAWPMDRNVCTLLTANLYKKATLCALNMGDLPCGADGGGGLFIERGASLDAEVSNSAGFTTALTAVTSYTWNAPYVRQNTSSRCTSVPFLTFTEVAPNVGWIQATVGAFREAPRLEWVGRPGCAPCSPPPGPARPPLPSPPPPVASQQPPPRQAPPHSVVLPPPSVVLPPPVGVLFPPPAELLPPPPYEQDVSAVLAKESTTRVIAYGVASRIEGPDGLENVRCNIMSSDAGNKYFLCLRM
jgi:hypothetical protein